MVSFESLVVTNIKVIRDFVPSIKPIGIRVSYNIVNTFNAAFRSGDLLITRTNETYIAFPETLLRG